MLVRCECGHPLSGDNQKGMNYYRCSHAKGKDATCLHTKNYRQDFIEEQILEVLGKIKVPESIVQWAMEQLREVYKTEVDSIGKSRIKHQQDLNGAKQRLTRITEKWLSPQNVDGVLLSDEEYRGLKFQIQEEIERLKLLTEDNEGSEANLMEKCEGFFDLTRKLKSAYQNGTPTEKRTLLHIIGSNFILTGNQLAVELHKPFAQIFRANAHHNSIRTASNPIQKQGFITASAEIQHWRDRRDSNSRPPP